MKCLGVNTIDDLYDVITEYEGEDFANKVRDFLHGRSDASLSDRQEILDMNKQEVDVEIRTEKHKLTLGKQAKQAHKNTREDQQAFTHHSNESSSKAR